MPNLTDALIDAANRHIIDLLRVSSSMRNDVLMMLAELEANLIDKINRYAGKSELTASTLRSLLHDTREIITKAYDGILADQSSSLSDVAKASATEVATAVNTEIGVKLLSGKLASADVSEIVQSFVLGRPAGEWWERQAATLIDNFTVQMRLGMLQGESIADLTRRVRGTKAAGFTDGVMEASRRQAEALVRTSAISTANVSRLATFTNNADLIKGVQWVSTLDNRTTPICIALDGLQWTLPDSGDPEDYGGYDPIDHDKAFPGPTAHFNCRSTQVSVLKSFDELSGNDAKKVPADSQDMLDGEGGTPMSYKDWLDKQDADTQDEILGATAGRLYRAGDLDLTDITNQNNRPLTAGALASKYG